MTGTIDDRAIQVCHDAPLEDEESPIPLTLTVKIRHGILWNLRKQFGSNAALARYLGITQNELCAWTNCRTAPAYERLKNRRKAYRLKKKFAALGYLWEDIFPDALQQQDWLDRPKDFEITKHIPSELLMSAGALRKVPSPDQRLIHADSKTILHQALETRLTPRERQVLHLRYGLEGDEPWADHEIARKLGISMGRVYQITQKALNKLRRGACGHNLYQLLH